MALDGSVRTVPRWRLKRTFDEKYPMAETLGNANTGIVKKILGMERGMYKVKWKVPRGSPKQITWTHPSNIRRVNDDLNELTPEEIAFFKGRTVKAHYALKYSQEDIATLSGYLADEAVNALLIHAFDDSTHDALMKCALTYLVIFDGYDPEEDQDGADYDLVGENDWSQIETLYLPINVNYNHWVLGQVIFHREGDKSSILVNVYDSFNKLRHRYQDLDKGVKSFLERASGIKTITIKYLKCAQQNDSEACGVFMVENAIALFNGEQPPEKITPAEVIALRQKYRAELDNWEHEEVRKTSA
jgi:hypothetical protein